MNYLKYWPIAVFIITATVSSIGFAARTEMRINDHTEDIAKLESRTECVSEIPYMKEDSKEIKTYLDEMTKSQIELMKAVERIEAKL